MEDLAVFIALYHSGSFRMYFIMFKKKCYLPAKGRSVWKKTVTSALKMMPSAYGFGQHFQDLGHSFSPYGPPSQQITYIYLSAKPTVNNVCSHACGTYCLFRFL